MTKYASLLALFVGCGGPPAERPPTTAGADLRAVTEPVPAADKISLEPEPAPVEPPPMPREIVSIEATTRVFAAPRRDASVLGVIVSGARVEKRGDAEGEVGRCSFTWIEIAPRGWVCVKTKPTDEPPTEVALPHLDKKRPVPGTAGTIRDGRIAFSNADAITRGEGSDASGREVRMTETRRIGDTIYWLTTDGDLVAARDIRRSRGSSFEGVFVDGESELNLPLAFAHKDGDRAADVPIFDEPGGALIGALEPREAVNVKHTTHNGRWLKLETDGWISGSDARLAELAEPPDGLDADDVWLDFNRDTQVAIVYRGSAPIYATLTSSGKYGHRTPTGVYRVEKKVAKTTMNSAPDAEEPYEVKDVPWVLFFHNGYALHGAYWHNKFGTPVSHGCVNLSPTDAKVVYEMLGPTVPAGWSVATATPDDPGAVVRVKTNANLTPGYLTAL